MIDTHCHLDLVAKSLNIDTVIEQARVAGVTHFIVPSTHQQSWSSVRLLSERFLGVYYALGIHPLFVSEDSLEYMASLELLLDKDSISQRRCVAIGECGLDFFQGREDEALQTRIFRHQLKLANKYQLPVIVHARKSHQEVLAILKQEPVLNGGVIHGFSGSYELAMSYIKHGFYIGVGGTITYERAKKTRTTISKLPLNRIVLETDAPDMPVDGYQGDINQPKRLKLVLSSLNLMRSEEVQTVASQLAKNSKLLFNLCDH
jgi:TatD DNase family protein